MTGFRAGAAMVVAFTVALTAPWLWPGAAHAEPVAYLDWAPVRPSPTCGGTVRGEAMVVPVQVDYQVHDGVRVSINYDAGIYDGSCKITVTADWKNLDTGASGSEDITAVSTIDGHYGFIGYANKIIDPGSGTVVVTLSSHPGQEMRVTPE
ncbi:hypothetical protein KL953_00795 [Mycolicibacterium goodii]|uniref:hypothetical protein n=1 Tax=Mycolicibacterium goodii TaxID=134601 RepID=UPI001BDCEFFA|nr:hypothetical protein [Mycolicibacterium goodii]MBU8807428.1 hypothetical protein [Mycolicibacterium goodii]